MSRGKRIKYLMFVGLALALVSSLVAGACAPAAAPTDGEGAAEIAALEAEVTDLEGDVAAEKTKAKKLQDEIAALKKPVKVQTWEPSSWLPAGIVWDSVVYMADYITRMSDGRIVVTPSAPGAVFPVAEGIDAIAAGLTEATTIWPGYFPGKVPVTAFQGGDVIIPATIAEVRYLYEDYEGGRILEILREEYAKFGVHLAGNIYWTSDNIITSSVPIYGIDDLKGVAFRSSELVAIVLAELGAGTIWTPGGEIYTNLATGVVDAATYSGAPDALAMSFHEVTSYWIREPVALAGASDALVVNPDVWQALSDDLKAIVEAATEVASARNSYMFEIEVGKAWMFVEEYGITIIEWPEEDKAIWFDTIRATAEREFLVDAASTEYFEIAERFMIEAGYWVP